MAQTMNMTNANEERLGPFRIATLAGASKGPEESRASLAHSPHAEDLTLTWQDEQAIFSSATWEGGPWTLRLALIKAVLATFDCISNVPAAELCWLFSSKSVRRADASGILARWAEDGAPPVLDLIDFMVDDHADGRLIRTVGLADIVGHEIDAVIAGDCHRELAEMVGLLAQEVLLSGPLQSAGAFGPDGREYVLTRATNEMPGPPTIRLTS